MNLVAGGRDKTQTRRVSSPFYRTTTRTIPDANANGTSDRASHPRLFYTRHPKCRGAEQLRVVGEATECALSDRTRSKLSLEILHQHQIALSSPLAFGVKDRLLIRRNTESPENTFV